MYNFFVNENQKLNDKYVITGADFNHIKNVLRMTVGDTFLVSDNGVSNLCEIEGFESEDGKKYWVLCYNGKKFLECKENQPYFLNNYMPFKIACKIAGVIESITDIYSKISELTTKVNTLENRISSLETGGSTE